MTKFVVDNGKNLIQAYDAAETDALLNQKANAEDVYNKTEVDAKDYDLEQRIAAVDVKFADYYPQFAIDMMLDGKANTSGEYDDITAGHAKQLTSRVGETDKTPYNFRTSGGSLDIGDLETDKIIGGSVAWNQLMRDPSLQTQAAARSGSLSVSDGVATMTSDGTGNCYFAMYADYAPANHVVLMSIDINYDVNNANDYSDVRIMTAWQGGNAIVPTAPKGQWKKCSVIVKPTADGAAFAVYCFGTESTPANETVKFKNPLYIDLTQMFGATIADYIYSLEQGAAGAGVAWFKKLFPKSYYSYNAGQIMSVKTSKHVTVGFNAWDEETRNGYYNSTTGEFVSLSSSLANKNPIKVVPNTVYYGKSDSYALKVFFYDANMNFLQTADETNKTFTTPANCYYINFSNAYGEGSTYNNDICINLSWDGERNGEYEPYVANEYYLQNDLELRGIFKLDANNKLYADGDEYPDSGEVTRKYGIIDLGSINWSKTDYSEFRANYVSNNIPLPKNQNENIKANALCSKMYDVLTAGQTYRGANKGIATADTYLSIGDDSFADAATLKTALSGVYFVYELATTTAETVNGYTNPQKVDDFGTEQYVDGREVEIPVGHETFYVANLKAKLEMSPDSPDADGLYLMQHSNGENVYTPYISPIPALPSTDGTFVLKCTVSGTTKTLTWVEET